MTTAQASGHRALFREYQMGSLVLPNRIVMAPLTRSRADGEGVPSPTALAA
jgi:N-ethylmaleimide reductase